MFFKKKYIEDCIIKCIDKKITYGVNDDGRNTSLCEYQFMFVDKGTTKLLYEYDEDSNLYIVDQTYKAKFNTQDSTFEVGKPC